MMYFTAGEVINGKMLKRFDGIPYGTAYARKLLIIAKDTPTPLYFPDAKKVEGRYGDQWAFSSEDIEKFNSRY